MKKLYNILKQVLTEHGFNVANYGENSFRPDERTVAITINDMAQVEPSFNVIEATINLTFYEGEWADNALKLSDALLTFIPKNDRPDEETKQLMDNSAMMTLLEVPSFTEVELDYDEETAEETQTLTFTIYFTY
jgi:hypothetical protein